MYVPTITTTSSMSKIIFQNAHVVEALIWKEFIWIMKKKYLYCLNLGTCKQKKIQLENTMNLLIQTSAINNGIEKKVKYSLIWSMY